MDKNTWDTVKYSLVSKATLKWESLKLMVGYNHGGTYPELYEAIAFQDFIKFYARLQFWDIYCSNPVRWFPNTAKYYLEFLAVYESWNSFIMRLHPQDDIRCSIRKLLNIIPPDGCLPHHNSVVALTNALDWTTLRETSLAVEVFLNHYANERSESISANPPNNPVDGN